MTTHAHILDALRTMEERGVEPTWEDFEAMAELLNDENETNEPRNMVDVPTVR